MLAELCLGLLLLYLGGRSWIRTSADFSTDLLPAAFSHSAIRPFSSNYSGAPRGIRTHFTGLQIRCIAINACRAFDPCLPCVALASAALTWWMELDSNQRGSFDQEIYSLSASASRPPIRNHSLRGHGAAVANANAPAPCLANRDASALSRQGPVQ